MSDLFNPELYVSDVSVYYGSKCAVQNVSFDIQPGQLTAIIGNNGCGKTSLIRAVMNLLNIVENACLVNSSLKVCLSGKEPA